MKKLLMGFIGLTLASGAMAAATVKITSFTYPAQGQVYAELCGLVEGAETSPNYVRVVVDHKSNRPGIYNAIAGKDGKFCVTVTTYRGTAEATIME
jgi:hypothetical protein